MNRAQIGFGQLRHARLRPRRHVFAYPTYFLLLPMRSLRERGDPLLRRNRFGLISFHDSDHGDGRGDCLAWLEELLARAGEDEADGEIWLQAYPRVLGYAFKPVSFWYCHRRDGTLAVIVVEVNNTFGERHCYLLSGPQLRWGRELQAAKVFHVSPFCRVEGRYRFRFLRTSDPGPRPERIVVRIDHDDAHGPLLQTSLSGQLCPLTPIALRRAFFGAPWLSLGVTLRIHWQALRLWLKRVPWFSKPGPPDLTVTHGAAPGRQASRHPRGGWSR